MPRLWCPGGNRLSIAASAAASNRLIITGVASTSIRPEPTKGAVCSCPTTISVVPARPGLIWARMGLILAGAPAGGGFVIPPYSAVLRDFEPTFCMFRVAEWTCDAGTFQIGRAHV